MNEAKTTWALVVGIDKYDDPSLRPLKGAVADAVAAVGWLRKLGVTDDRIFLHASPSADSRAMLDGLGGLPYKPADETSIWGSVAALRKVKDGTRLFVFLSGHGLYDPETRRLFLTQEAGSDMGYANLGMDEYIELFRSMAFKRQFLFLDGCQNYPYSERARPTIKAAMKSGVTGYTAKPGNTLIACYAAGQDERAVDQIDGHGALSRYLFEAIDLETPWSLAVDLDFSTGARTLNLRRLIEAYVGPAVSEAAAKQSPPVQQSPSIEVSGPETAASRCMVRLKDLPTALLELVVEPEGAGADVQRVSIMVEQDGRGEPLDWKRWLPPPLTATISFPVPSRIPVGLEVEARCKLRPGTSWKGDIISKVTVDQNRIVPFRMISGVSSPSAFEEGLHGTSMEQTAAALDAGSMINEGNPLASDLSTEIFHIRTYSRGGGAAYNAVDYGALEGSLEQERAAGDVEIVHHEHGPDIVVRSNHSGYATRIAEAYAREIQRITPAEIGVSMSVPAMPTEAEPPNLNLVLPPGGASALAGLIAGEEMVRIGSLEEANEEPEQGGRTVSPLALETESCFRVEPGPTWIRVALPWGSWVKLIQVPLAAEARVELPATIGIPPLRVLLHSEAERRESLIFGVEGSAPTGSVLRGVCDSGPGIPLVKADPGKAQWALQPERELKDAPLGCGLVTLVEKDGMRISFPFLETRGVALDRKGGGLRAEPLAVVPLPVWDKLVASGRLESLSPAETGELIADRKNEWLLVVAAAYTVHASPAKFQKPFFSKVLRNLKDLAASREKKGRSAPDLDLLRIALAARSHRFRGSGMLEEPKRGWFLSLEATNSLRLWAEAGSVPVFRWGVPLALHLLSWARAEEPFASWREALAGIAPRLSPLSVWTAWTTAAELKAE
jgi:hypothetical protein